VFFNHLKRVSFIALAALLLLPAANVRAADVDTMDADGTSADIISKFVAATEGQQNVGDSGSVEMDISASLPKLQKQGHLRALKKISRLGHSTYRVLSFQGDNTVKQQVIARYLEAEQKAQGDRTMAITPANYKFKYEGERDGTVCPAVYVFNLSPRKKRVGLFRGELWIDAQTYLPVYEKGRFVKNPSIFFKRVDFERAYTIRDGKWLPEHMTSTINAHVVGTVELDVYYSNFSSAVDASDEEGSDSGVRPAIAVAAAD